MNRRIPRYCIAAAFGWLALAQAAAPPAASPAPHNTTVQRDLAYVADGHARQKLDLYLPQAGTNLPLIINIHGGAFRAGGYGPAFGRGKAAR